MNANVQKTIQYIKRNGLKKTIPIILERKTAHYFASYSYIEPDEETLSLQRKEKGLTYMPKISIVVPTYETNPLFLEQLLASVAGQSYTRWELILADASASDIVKQTVNRFICKAEGLSIHYVKLSDNKGISANTNEGLFHATGEYVGLLDHDDLLTKDALFEMVKALQDAKNRPKLVYSDEDKLDSDTGVFFDPNLKPDFNLDLLLSNNYICHFLVMETNLMKSLKFRPEYDGAQDYDLILRGVMRIGEQDQIAHVSKVLYHWRCHMNSTAANPASKLYAYEAGRRALQDLLDQEKIAGVAQDTEHVGFYKIAYSPALFAVRKDVSAIGGLLSNREHKIVSGPLNDDLTCPFAGIRDNFAGPCNALSVTRDMPVLDARTMLVRDDLIPLYEKIIKMPYIPDIKDRTLSYTRALDNRIWLQRSKALCEEMQGLKMYVPGIVVRY